MKIDMKDKRFLVQSALNYMATYDVQNTEGDYDKVHLFVSHIVSDYWDRHDLQYDERKIREVIFSILNPLWDFYFNHLHDGYNVD